MPSEGKTQKSAGVKLPTPPLNNGMKTMKVGKGFRIKPQEKKGINAVLNANK